MAGSSSEQPNGEASSSKNGVPSSSENLDHNMDDDTGGVSSTNSNEDDKDVNGEVYFFSINYRIICF